jgi:hypothetical protein
MRLVINAGAYPGDPSAETLVSGLRKIALMLAELHNIEINEDSFVDGDTSRIYHAATALNEMFGKIYERKD